MWWRQKERHLDKLARHKFDRHRARRSLSRTDNSSKRSRGNPGSAFLFPAITGFRLNHGLFSPVAPTIATRRPGSADHAVTGDQPGHRIRPAGASYSPGGTRIPYRGGDDGIGGQTPSRDPEKLSPDFQLKCRPADECRYPARSFRRKDFPDPNFRRPVISEEHGVWPGPGQLIRQAGNLITKCEMADSPAAPSHAARAKRAFRNPPLHPHPGPSGFRIARRSLLDPHRGFIHAGKPYELALVNQCRPHVPLGRKSLTDFLIPCSLNT